MTIKILNKNKGFTLIEIFIVGALIALFAAMAIINIQGQFETNLRKITIGETREIGTALSFAYQDVGVFPKFSFLNRSLNMLFQISGPNTLPPGFDYMGFNLSILQSRILSNWRGGYFSLAGTRNRIAQGRGGTVRMYIPELQTDLPWPADPWGNPYVLYLLYVDNEGRYDFINSPVQEPNFFCAVVSYGRNKVPGGTEDTPSNDPVLSALRLYEPYQPAQGIPFRTLTLTEYTPLRASAYSRPGDAVRPGIVDRGSDDIYYEF